MLSLIAIGILLAIGVTGYMLATLMDNVNATTLLNPFLEEGEHILQVTNPQRGPATTPVRFVWTVKQGKPYWYTVWPRKRYVRTGRTLELPNEEDMQKLKDRPLPDDDKIVTYFGPDEKGRYKVLTAHGQLLKLDPDRPLEVVYD